MSGKQLRLKRILPPVDCRTVIFPLDHGVTCGPIPGIERIETTIEAGTRGGADAIVLHKGNLRCLHSVKERLPGVIMHLSASTSLGPAPYRKVPTGGIEEAIRLGADAVSVHLNLGNAYESEMLRDVGRIGQSCTEWQVPLLIMAYVSRDATGPAASGTDIAHAARIAAELGADVVKIPFPGDYDTVARIASVVSVPVVIAGGSPAGVDLLLERVEKSIQAGAAGVAAGRSIFQAKNPEAVLRAVTGIVHRGMHADEAGELLKAERET